ncbi:MAG: MmgE/PrpD family protein, partial [Deltaproteobacteria bacterium]|nr:MmgE/PrpD family protein [Deltaproteobacteria bacterium]
YTNEKVHNPKFHELREKVEMRLHPEWDQPGVAGTKYPIAVTMKDGSVYKKVCPGGDDVITLSDEELMERYQGCALQSLSEEKADQAAKIILNIDKVENISELMNILTYTDK